MKKRTVLVGSISICMMAGIFLSSCKESRPIKSCDTFVEMKDPTSDTLSDWSKVAPGLNASFVSIDNKYSKSVAPEITQTTVHTLTGWKGERLSGQILLWSTSDIKQVECEISDLKSASATIPSSTAQARFVRYVMTDTFAEGCGHRKPEDFPASLAPDMLDNLDCFDMEAKTARPVWLTFDIPRSATAGEYKGTITVSARDQKDQQFEIHVNVQDRVLPEASTWEYHLDFWQHPSAVARVHNLEMWSDAHFEAMKPYMKMVADMGQKVITTTLNKDPWNIQCFDPYADMIQWTKNQDGTWTYDYAVFDRWVQYMLDMGVTKMINCYSMIPWNNELHYKDATTGEMVNIVANPGTKIFEEVWTPFLKDFSKHLSEKKWREITNIAMDERSPEEMAKTIGLLQKVAPELGISYADNHKSYKKYPFIKDISIGAEASVDREDIVARQAKGLITTYYICCSHSFPNIFTFSGSAEAVYTSWYAIAAGFDGLLHWSYNSWVENPLTDSRFRTWPAGDTYMIYPESRSSIRYERTLEGVQDVEKVRILKAELATDALKLEKLNKEIAKFNTIEPQSSYIDMLNKAKALVNELSAK